MPPTTLPDIMPIMIEVGVYLLFTLAAFAVVVVWVKAIESVPPDSGPDEL